MEMGIRGSANMGINRTYVGGCSVVASIVPVIVVDGDCAARRLQILRITAHPRLPSSCLRARRPPAARPCVGRSSHDPLPARPAGRASAAYRWPGRRPLARASHAHLRGAAPQVSPTAPHLRVCERDLNPEGEADGSP